MRVNGEKRGIDFLFRFSILLLLCIGAHAWFTWFTYEFTTAFIILLYGFFSVIAFTYKQVHHIKFQNYPLIVVLSFLFILAHSFPRFGPSVPLVCILQLYPILVLIFDNNNASKNLEFISKGLSILFVLGLLIWAVVIRYDIPSYPIRYPNDNDDYYFFNYIFYIKRVYLSDGIVRFQSVFLEPSYLGTLVSFVLYANRYDFKRKYNIINFIALVCSFSLAGYVTSFIGYVVFRINNHKGIKTIISCSFIILVVFIIGLNYKDGDNYFNHMIIERLQFDQEKVVQGNNRFIGKTDEVFERALQNGDILWGDPKIDHSNGGEIDGAGYKIFLLTNGLISAICYLLFYFLISRLIWFKFNNYSFLFILLIVLTFLQASYPESYSWIIPFVLGCLINRYFKNNNVI